MQSAGAGRAVDLPGFPPVESFFDFLLAGAMIQSALLAGNSGGIALAIDIEMGFTDRLLAAPIPRFAIVAGRLAGTAAMGMVTAVWFLAIGLIFGVTIEEGVLGALLMIVLVTASALAFGTLGAALALRSGSASVVQGTFPLVFVILFLSTAFFPDDLLLEPAQTIARDQPAQLHRRRRPRPRHLGLLGPAAARGRGRDRPRRRDRAGALLDGAAAPAADRLMGATLDKDLRDDRGARPALRRTS